MKLTDLKLKSNFQYHKILNPKIWSGEKLAAGVSASLKKIAAEFVEFSGIPKSALKDIIIVGSIVNYNWNKHSDVDLHILMDYGKIKDICDEEIVDEFLRAKRSLWMKQYPLTVEGLPVEISFQDIEDDLKSEASFSVTKNEWIKKPVHNEPEVDEEEYDKKVRKGLEKVKKVLANDNLSSDQISKFKDSIRAERKAALGKSGELDVDNLVFKALRNQGLLDKLSDKELKTKIKELST